MTKKTQNVLQWATQTWSKVKGIRVSVPEPSVNNGRVNELSDRESTWLEEIRENGTKNFALSYLGISRENLTQVRNWDKIPADGKLDILAKGMESIRHFHTGVYANYKRFKARKRATWKTKNHRYHLLKIRDIIDKAIVEDSLSADQAKEISMRSFFAFYTYVNPSKAKRKTKQAKSDKNNNVLINKGKAKVPAFALS